ncbi:Uncharacterised protein [Serratia quinivorans]|uniref:hypothetical protein n=1 Tax=Serratia quinivorans TaxID=137545 RepID=UPI0021796694|nr:hypothetical protein [Serratia quinivorans]CAI1965036.1 Uncharacterised protein [Serratia quinivorans]
MNPNMSVHAISLKNMVSRIESVDDVCLHVEEATAKGVALYANGKHQVKVTVSCCLKDVNNKKIRLTEDDRRALEKIAPSHVKIHPAGAPNTSLPSEWVVEARCGQYTRLIVTSRSVLPHHQPPKKDGDVHFSFWVSRPAGGELVPLNLSASICFNGKTFTPSGEDSYITIEPLVAAVITSADMKLSYIDTASILKNDDGDPLPTKIDQDNWSLYFTDAATTLKTATITAGPQLGALDATADDPAVPFAVWPAYGGVSNFFVWPFGSASDDGTKTVCTLYTSIKTPNGQGSVDRLDTSSTTKMTCTLSVDDKANCLNFTRLLTPSTLTGASAVQTQNVSVYVSVADQYGNSGQVIVSPSSDGNTLVFSDWGDVFDSIYELGLEFADNSSAGTASIFTNGLNQIPIMIFAQLLDKYGITIPLSSADLQSAGDLNFYESGQKLKWNSSATSTSDTWEYSGTKNNYCGSVSYTAGGSSYVKEGVFDTTTLTSTEFYLLSKQDTTYDPTDISAGITINGIFYSTSQGQTPSSTTLPQHLHIEAVAPKVYTTADMTFTSQAQNGVSASDNNGAYISYLNSNMYYLNIATDGYNITSVTKATQNHQFSMYAKDWWCSWCTDYTYYYGECAKNISNSWSYSKYTISTNGAVLKINQLPGMCYGNLYGDFTVPVDAGSQGNTTATFIDNYGNTGSFIIKADGDGLDYEQA